MGCQREWLVKLVGPADSPYESGVYCVRVVFPESYPWVAPSLTFETPIWHPNICPQTGRVQLEALYPQWLFSISMLQVLEGLLDLLACPRVEEPLEDVCPTFVDIDKVRHQFCFAPKVFEKVARRWNRKSVQLETFFHADQPRPRANSFFASDPAEDSPLLLDGKQRLSCRKISVCRERVLPRSPLAA